MAQGCPRLCLSCFGAALPEFYGMHYHDVPAGQAEANCLAAVSVTALRSLYVEPGTLKWLRDRPPPARIGSINVYDLRKHGP